MFRSTESNRRGKKARSVRCVATVVAILALASPFGQAQGPKGHPTPPARLTPQQVQDLRGEQYAKRKVGARIANPHAAGGLINPSVLGVLRSQRQAADAEQQEILRAQTVMADGSVRPGRSDTTQRPVGTASAPVVKHGSTPPTNVPQPKQCLISTVTVNGQTSGVWFTPLAQMNLYTIKGCGFGDKPGNVYLEGPFAKGRVQLQLPSPQNSNSHWSDTAIITHVDPMLSGESDQDNVTLVIEPAGATPIKKSGFKFYAAREEILLQRIPLNAVRFSHNGSLPKEPKPSTPGFPNGPVFTYDSPYGAPDVSASVDRETGQDLPAGSDYFDFSSLSPGFQTDSMKVDILDGADPAPGQWDGDNIRVLWNPVRWGCALNSTTCTNYQSTYWISVWVVGPRGVEPWGGLTLKRDPRIQPH